MMKMLNVVFWTKYEGTNTLETIFVAYGRTTVTSLQLDGQHKEMDRREFVQVYHHI